MGRRGIIAIVAVTLSLTLWLIFGLAIGAGYRLAENYF